MRKFIFLFILIFLTISRINAQKYNDSNVHYYLPNGCFVEDVNKIPHPYLSAASGARLDAKVIVERGNSIYVYLIGRYVSDVERNREKYINAIQRNIRGNAHEYLYNSSLSTSKYDVYSRSVPPSMFGNGNTFYYAISKDYKELIEWDEDRGTDRRHYYYEFDIETLLPKAESYDFLD